MSEDTKKQSEDNRYLELRQEIELLHDSLHDWYSTWKCHSADDADEAIRHTRDQLRQMVSKIQRRHPLLFKYKILIGGKLMLTDISNGVGIQTDAGRFEITSGNEGLAVSLDGDFLCTLPVRGDST